MSDKIKGQIHEGHIYARLDHCVYDNNNNNIIIPKPIDYKLSINELDMLIKNLGEVRLMYAQYRHKRVNWPEEVPLEWDKLMSHTAIQLNPILTSLLAYKS